MTRRNPRLFTASATSFTTRGIGTLTDALSCEVTEGRNAGFTLEMQLPVTSKHFKEIRPERILLAKPNPYDNPQAFRIHKITKPMDGIVTVFANHLSYDLRGYPVNSFIAEGAAQAVSLLKSSAVTPCPFTITTDITSDAVMTAADPHTIRDYMGTMEGSLIDTYHGEYQFDNFTVRLLASRGRNRGVKIKYGINLIDLTQEENCASVYTGVLPFFSSENMGRVIGDVQRAAGTFEVERILPLNLTDKYDDGEEPPTVAQLNRDGAKYITDNSVGVPKVSLDLNFAQLDRKEVHLCDTVTVVFEKLNIEAEAKVIKTVYDVLNDRYVSVKLGDPRANIANSLADEKAAREAAGKQLRTYIEKTDKAIRLEAVARKGADDAMEAVLSVHAEAISARVTKEGANQSRSFSWSLTDAGHYWYANNTEVMRVTASGLEVKGKVIAESGFIGNGSYGFEILASAIRNGMQSLSDTAHNGVYIGTDGIALGGGKFKVDAAGNLTASSGAFTGSVRADKILYGSSGGTLSGAAITPQTIGTGSGTALTAGAVSGIGWGNNFGSMTQKAYTAAAVQTDYLRVTSSSIWVGTGIFGAESKTVLTGVSVSLTYGSPYYIYAMSSDGSGSVAIPRITGVSRSVSSAAMSYLGSSSSPA